MVGKKFKASNFFEILFFLVFGVPLLILAQARDAVQFLMLTYRGDVREISQGGQAEHIMTSK